MGKKPCAQSRSMKTEKQIAAAAANLQNDGKAEGTRSSESQPFLDRLADQCLWH